MNLFLEDLKKRKYGVDEILFVDGFLLFYSPEMRDLFDIKVCNVLIIMKTLINLTSL